MLYAAWFQRTGANLNGRRSTALRAIDAALNTYQGAPTLPNLRVLDAALVAWQRSKRTFWGNENWANSRRAAVVIIELAHWIGDEYIARGAWPRPEAGWNNNHNCYAYAMKCRNPTGMGNNSRPGRYAGNGVGYGDAAPNAATWKQDMVDQIRADAVANGVTIQATMPASPIPVPALVADGRYLAALIGFQMGYHFLRRDEGSRRWSHKNGSAADVETSAFHNIKGRCFVLDDQTVGEMLSRPADWEGVTVQMQFIAYLSVPQDGIQVRG